MAFCTREKSFSSTKEAEKGAEPRGTPKMQISDVGTKVTPGMGHGSDFLVLSQDHSHLEGLRWRPKAGPLSFSRVQTEQAQERRCHRVLFLFLLCFVFFVFVFCFCFVL